MSTQRKSFNTEDFNKKASTFNDRFGEQKARLEKCLETRVNDDINFVCAKEKESYLLGIATTFCETEYNSAVRCQQEEPSAWASACFAQNTNFGKCADAALRKMYIYNLEHNRKNPSAVPTPGSK